MLGWFYPEVHDASENLGAQLNAHYDEVTKRWVFPGEEAIEDPALGPPPTESFLAAAAAARNPTDSKGTNLGSRISDMCLDGFTSHIIPFLFYHTGMKSDSESSLATLMAPPPRNMSMPSISSTDHKTQSSDALNSLIAPPSWRPSHLSLGPPPSSFNSEVRIWTPNNAQQHGSVGQTDIDNDNKTSTAGVLH